MKECPRSLASLPEPARPPPEAARRRPRRNRSTTRKSRAGYGKWVRGGPGGGVDTDGRWGRGGEGMFGC